MSKKHAEQVPANAKQVFEWLTRVADIAVTQGLEMSIAIGIDEEPNVLKLESMKNDLAMAMNEINIMQMNIKARANAIADMVKDLM